MNRLNQTAHSLIRVSLRFPKTTWTLGLILTLAGLLTAAFRLELKTSNLDLVSAKVPEISRFMSFAETFGTPNVLIVVLEGEDEDLLSLTADRAAEQIQSIEGVYSVLYRAMFSDAVLQLLDEERYIWTHDHSSLYLFVQPSDPTSSASEIEPLVRQVRTTLDDLLPAGSGVSYGLTGIPEYAVNDKDFIQQDLKRISVLALIGILAVFILGFQAWRSPLCAVICLGCSAAVTLGITSFLPGHLTLLSASFISILFGLGIDFGIHAVKRCEESLEDSTEISASIASAMNAVSPSLLTGALTTALVFFGMMASGLKGFAELGWIAGVGILICLLSTLTLLPAGLLLIYRGKHKPAPSPGRGQIFARLPNRWVGALITLGTLAALFMPSIPFDSDYLALEPKASEAVRLERAMIEGSDVSPLFAVFTLENEEAAAALADRLFDEPMIGQIRTLAGLRDLGLPEKELEGIPESLLRQFRSGDGRWTVYAYPVDNLWKPEAQEAFVTRMREIHPNVTGMPFIGQYMLEQSRLSLQRVSWIAFFVLALCLFLDFRSWRPALAALLPTLMTFLLMRLFMRAGGLTFNPLNIMALPVILGIAVDDGVHLVHRVMEEGHVSTGLRSTGRSIFLTTLTSLISFGLLGFARHQGLASFGQLLALGITCSLAVTLIWLPLVLPRLLNLDRHSPAV